VIELDYMQNGSNSKFYSLRASPGAGKNFLATLLNSYHNSDPFLIHYSQTYNEYFNTSEMIVDSAGPYTIPFWDGRWKFVNIRLRNDTDLDNKIVHEHEWVSTKSGSGNEYVRRFMAYDETDGKIGINPKLFIEKIIQGYYITTKTPEEYNFIAKMIFIKKFLGNRPNIMFDKKYSNFSSDSISKILFLSPLGNLEIGYNYDLDITRWIEFVNFLQKIPYSYPLSGLNYNYFVEYNTGKFKLNIDTYLIYYEQFKDNWLKSWNNTELKFIKLEIKNLEQFKQANPNIKEISYKDLFLDQIETGTVFDNFKNEIAEYTKRNFQLVETIENYFGKILN
jgi:hypothetical protein